jgi:predicted aspartyl protease
MGIGETVENQADMLLCPSISFDGRRDNDVIDADILVTNPLPGSPHILTMDYLLHRAPCVVLTRAERIYFRLPVSMASLMRPTFEFHDVRMVGGAFSVHFVVGDARLDLVVDTGASTTISLSSTSLKKLQTCAATTKSVIQVGVNGERVCSNVVSTNVRVGRIDLGNVEVLANTAPVQGSDGYVGMGLLRALDMWFEHGRLGVRRSGLSIRSIDRTRSSSCPSGTLPPACSG